MGLGRLSDSPKPRMEGRAPSVHCKPPQPFRDPQGRKPGFRSFFLKPVAGPETAFGEISGDVREDFPVLIARCPSGLLPVLTIREL